MVEAETKPRTLCPKERSQQREQPEIQAEKTVETHGTCMAPLKTDTAFCNAKEEDLDKILLTVCSLGLPMTNKPGQLIGTPSGGKHERKLTEGVVSCVS